MLLFDIEMIFIILVLFQIKHFVADFPLQTMTMVQEKGQYGKFGGVAHSAIHGLFTAMIVIAAGALYDPFFARDYLILSFILGFVDFVLHYHIDWIKMRFGNRDLQTPAFWNQLGLDQMAHQLTYLMLTYIIVSF